MPVFVVAKPKGGAGKHTLATKLAGWLAGQGHAPHARLSALAPPLLNIPNTQLPSPNSLLRDPQNDAPLAARGLTLFNVAPAVLNEPCRNGCPSPTG